MASLAGIVAAAALLVPSAGGATEWTGEPALAVPVLPSVVAAHRMPAQPAAAEVAVAAGDADPVATSTPEEGWEVARSSDPARSVVTDADGRWVATFTDGARTVALHGPERRFDEDTATHGVTTDVWVRVLDDPFDGEVDRGWLADALNDPSPDVLEVTTQYWDGAPDLVDDDGVLLAADASYGPLRPDGSRPVGSDWHDFQGVDGVYPDRIDRPDPEEYRSLDCSGYVRMVYGERFGVPMARRSDGGASLPRRSMQQAAEAPGVVPIADTRSEVPAEQLDRLQAGDLVFFDAPSDDDGVIDHVGFYLGVDDAGHHRFVHSRPSADGPTMGGDAHGASVLDDGFYGEGFRSSRRL